MAEAGDGETEANPTPPPTTTAAAEPAPVEEATIPEATQAQPSGPTRKKRRLVKIGAKAAGKRKTHPQLLEEINDGSSGSEGKLDATSSYA